MSEAIYPSLAIIHRVCPVFSRTAVGYPNKLEMVKACAQSMAQALKGLRVSLRVILDGCPEAYEQLFSETFAGFDLTIEKTPSIGNLATFARQVECAQKVEAECVFFSEDDYRYEPMAFRAMLEAMKNASVDFVTPIDHPNLYDPAFEVSRRVGLLSLPLRHWRTNSTTCLTFMTRRETLHKTAQTLMSYARGVVDSSMWLALTQDSVFSPLALLRSLFYVVPRLLGFKVHSGRYQPLFAWKDHGLKLLSLPRYTLWSPMPELARHLSTDCIPITGRLTGNIGL